MSTLYKNPVVWNDSIWTFLYCIGENFPKHPSSLQKKKLKEFFSSLQYVLPCELCKGHYKAFFEKYPISKILHQKPIPLFRYMIRLRNYIMKFYPTSVKVMTVPQVRAQLREKCAEQEMTTKNPKVWGQHIWLFLHCSSFTFPRRPSPKDAENYDCFLKSLTYILPCKYCRIHLKHYLQQNPLEKHLTSRMQYVRYIIELHNYINKEYGKKDIVTMRKAKQLISENCLQEYERNHVPNIMSAARKKKTTNTTATNPPG